MAHVLLQATRAMTPGEIAGATANPHAAREGLARAMEKVPPLADSPGSLVPLAHLFAGSEYLSHWLLARPEEILWLVERGGLDRERGAGEMVENLRELETQGGISWALRRFKNRELARVCARELSGMATVERTVAEWSLVADVAIDAAARRAVDEARERFGEPWYTEMTGGGEKPASFAVLGLGKLGGGELNISSDVDLIYIHSSDNGATKGERCVPLHEFFVHIARRVTQLLSEVSDEGFVFRVDVDLRPEGGAGELTNSIGAMEVYYESWGQQWERQALLKARHCGGDPAVSREVLDRLQPFIFRKYLDETALAAIAGMKDKIDQAQRAKKSAKSAADNIKLGQGGIREIEFIVQAMQMLYGARRHALKTRSTLEALDICESLGFISAPHHRDLREAYLFYRRLENRIQYHQNQQTHLIPQDAARRATLARQMGIEGENPAGRLMEEIARRRRRVRAIFDLFFIRQEKAAETFPVDVADEEATTAWLDLLKFDHPQASARALNFMRYGSVHSRSSERSQARFDHIGPVMVAEAAGTAWPDHVILGFANFLEARGGGRYQFYELLDSNRSVIKLLAAIFSSSENLSASLLRQPDLLDRLLIAEPVSQPMSRADYARQFAAMEAQGRGEGDTLTYLNIFRTAETVRLGLRRILGLADRFELMGELTLLAEEYLAAIVRLARAEAGAPPPGLQWALVAAGKLGRREMNFGSDLDLLVFFDPGGAPLAAASMYVTQLTQSVIRLCAAMTGYGAGYPVDMRLRPEGENAPLAVSFAALDEYYRTRGAAWERLALAGARPIAGDAQFGATVAGAPPTAAAAAEILRIREKMISQKVKRGVVDIKFGRGGLVDIEFMCQWLAMEHPEALETAAPFTVTTLGAAARRGWLEPAAAAELREAYTLLRSIEDALRMDRDKAVSALPQNDPLWLRRLARAVSAPGGPDHLLELVTGAMGRVWLRFSDFFNARAG